MTMPPETSESPLAISRIQTRRLLMRALYRSHVRQQVVARRRTMLRQALWMLRWTAGAAACITALTWAGMQLGLVPRWRLVPVEQLDAPATQIAPPKAPALAIRTASPAAVPASSTLATDGEPPGVELKAESQLNSLMQ